MRKKLNNKKFWNERYSHGLDSGRGSRGDFIVLKSKIINDLIEEYNITSILDVGCGDCAVTKDVDMQNINYLGIDVSDVVVERNSRLFTERNFKVGNFDNVDNKYDLVICFDVLIHQPTRERYNQGIKLIKNSFNKCALVTGFNKNYNLNGICYYYEPIKDSFAEYRVEKMAKIEYCDLIKVV